MPPNGPSARTGDVGPSCGGTHASRFVYDVVHDSRRDPESATWSARVTAAQLTSCPTSLRTHALRRVVTRSDRCRTSNSADAHRDSADGRCQHHESWVR